jgi:hypothetical protein
MKRVEIALDFDPSGKAQKAIENLQTKLNMVAQTLETISFLTFTLGKDFDKFNNKTELVSASFRKMHESINLINESACYASQGMGSLVTQLDGMIKKVSLLK